MIYNKIQNRDHVRIVVSVRCRNNKIKDVVWYRQRHDPKHPIVNSFDGRLWSIDQSILLDCLRIVGAGFCHRRFRAIKLNCLSSIFFNFSLLKRSNFVIPQSNILVILSKAMKKCASFMDQYQFSQRWILGFQAKYFYSPSFPKICGSISLSHHRDVDTPLKALFIVQISGYYSRTQAAMDVRWGNLSSSNFPCPAVQKCKFIKTITTSLMINSLQWITATTYQLFYNLNTVSCGFK